MNHIQEIALRTRIIWRCVTGVATALILAGTMTTGAAAATTGPRIDGTANADLIAAGGPPAVGKPSGYVTEFPGNLGGARVVYRASNGHIWEQYLQKSTGVWSSADLTVQSGGTAAPAVGDPTGYVTEFPGNLGGARVVYRASNGHIWELYLQKSTGVWSSADLTALAGGPLAVGDPTGYVTEFPGNLGGARVVYRAASGHIWELYLQKSTGVWSSADLTVQSGGTAASAVGDPTGYVTEFPGNLGGARVVYRARNGHIWELYLQESRGAWSSADLTVQSGGSAASAVGDPTGYVTEFPGNLGGARVVYWAANGHIWELYLQKSTGVWSSADLTALAGGPQAIGDPTGYVTEFPGNLGGARVVYRAASGHIWELYLQKSTGVWSSADLTVHSGGTAASAAGDPTGYVTEFPGNLGGGRVVYRASNGHIWELYLQESRGAWSSADLT